MATVDLRELGPVAVVTLARPEKLNALDPAMLRALDEAVASLEQSAHVRAVVLAAAGERAFCVGADIHAWASLSPLDVWRTWIREGHRVVERLAQLRMPVLAAIQDYALGGGLKISLAADLRIAADTASFGMPDVSIATVPGWGGTSRLPALIGSARAKEMIFLGRRISAPVAMDCGLVNAVMPRAEVLAHALELAQHIAAQAPVQMAKEIINGDAPTLEAPAGALSAFTKDAGEGLASFTERRPNSYQGQ